MSVVRILQQFPVEGVEGCRGLRAGACIVLSVNTQHIRRLIPEHVREQFLFLPPCRRDGHLARLAFTVAQVADRSQAAVFSDDQGKGDLRAARCRACVHSRFFVEEAVFAFKLEDQAATQQGLTFGQAVEHLRPPVIQKGQQRLGVSVRAGIETLMMQRQKGLSFFFKSVQSSGLSAFVRVVPFFSLFQKAFERRSGICLAVEKINFFVKGKFSVCRKLCS